MTLQPSAGAFSVLFLPNWPVSELVSLQIGIEIQGKTKIAN